jgi:L-2-hydroxyglutarate oxidase LhgO
MREDLNDFVSAVKHDEVARMNALFGRAVANGCNVQLLTSSQVSEQVYIVSLTVGAIGS